MHHNQRGSRSRYNHNQPSVSGYVNPEALEAAQHLATISLDTLCQQTNQIKTMLNNGETTEAVAFWFQVFVKQVNATRKQLNYTAYLKHQQREQRSGSEGIGPTSFQFSTPLPSDPRELRRLQDTIQTRIQQAERTERNERSASA